GEPQPREAGNLADRAHQPGERVPRRTVAVAAEVDAGQDDLAVALGDPPPDLAENGLGAAAPRRSADERDHAEGVREAAAVLHLDERPHAVEPGFGLNAADRPDVAGDQVGSVLAAPPHHDDVLGEPR